MATDIHMLSGETISVDDDQTTVHSALQGADRFVRLVDSGGYPVVIARETVTHLTTNERVA